MQSELIRIPKYRHHVGIKVVGKNLDNHGRNEVPPLTGRILIVGTMVSFLLGRSTPGRFGVFENSDIYLGFIILLILAFLVLPLNLYGRKNRLLTPKQKITSGRVVLVLTIFIALSTTWQDRSIISSIYVIEAIYVGLLFGLLTFALQSCGRVGFELAIKSLVVLGTGLILIGLTSSSSRVSALGGGENVYGRNAAICALIWLIVGYGSSRQTFALTLSIICMCATVLSGSRGSMVALLITLAIISLRYFRSAKKSIQLLLVTAATGVVIWFNLGERVAQTWDSRVVNLTLINRYDSGRGYLRELSLDLFRQKPILGWGPDYVYTYTNGRFRYTHNIFFEFAVMGGIVGLGLIAISIYLIIRSSKITTDSYVSAARAGFFISLICAQFSGDYFDWRFILVFGALAEFGYKLRST